MGLTRKILLFTSLLVVGLVLSTLAVATAQADRVARASVEKGLAEARVVFETFAADRFAKLRLGVRVLGNDPAFKAAAQTGDAATVLDLLAERGRDLGADVFLATDERGRLVARSDDPGAHGRDLSAEPLVAGALQGGEPAGVWRQGDALFQAVSVRMAFGSETVGALIAAFRIDDASAAQVSRLAHGEIAFVAEGPGREARLVATALHGEREELASHLSSLPAPAVAPFPLVLGGDPHLGIRLPLPSASGAPVGSLLVLRSVEEERAPFTRFRRTLVIAGALLMGVALIAAGVASARITGPLRALVGLVEQVRDGSYTGEVRVDSADEIGGLARAFDRMRTGIAAREEQIRAMALQDPLTHLPNRALLGDRLQQELARSRRQGGPVTLLVLDLDRFKDVNDSLGHQAGDAVLQEVGTRLGAVLRGSDTVARFGPDQFAMLLPGTSAEDALRTAAKALASVREPLPVGAQTLHLSATVGLAACPQHGDDPASILRHAEAALQAARRGGTTVAAYDPAFDRDEPHHRLWLIEELRRAIPGGELVMRYQPQLDLRSGRVAGAEALVRWNHPRRGLLNPVDFVPLAEQTGLVRQMTPRVLGLALAEAGAWARAGRELAVSVNLSALDLVTRELPDVVAGLLAGSGLPPDRLCLEITESAVMQDPQQALGVLGALREQRVRISIDDFGTGYSSLSYLKRLPVGELKIDRSFVAGLAEGTDDAAIVRATVDLGHSLGLTVVAEGVESGEAMDLLRGLGCDLAQGYFVGRPMEAEALLRMSA